MHLTKAAISNRIDIKSNSSLCDAVNQKRLERTGDIFSYHSGLWWRTNCVYRMRHDDSL